MIKKWTNRPFLVKVMERMTIPEGLAQRRLLGSEGGDVTKGLEF